eukprot:6190767-Pleurochrysis_carterae.AAC.6
MAVTDAQRRSLSRQLLTSASWFSSPSCTLIYQCSNYLALHSSKGCAIGALCWQWQDTELHSKEAECLEATCWAALGTCCLAICGSRDIFFNKAAVTVCFSQTSSLRPYLEEEADLVPRPAGSCTMRSSPAFGWL